jgi:sugar lactone lactonase YvrE
MKRFAPVALLLFVAPLPLFAGKVKTVTIATPSNYDKARLEQTVVSSEGAVRLARALKPLATNEPLEAARVWDVAEDKAGNLYVATGDDGKIFKISPDGKVAVAFDSGDSQVLCLIAAANGSIYAGTGPGGRIVRIDPAGKASVLGKCPASYIWALVADDKTDSLYAATGPRGRVYKVGADGKANLFFQSRQDHILCLARSDDGTLYAGTDRQGLVYRIDSNGRGYVLFQAPQSEVRCLQLAGDSLYAGTSSPSGARSGGTSAGSVYSNSRLGMIKVKPQSDAVAADEEEKAPPGKPPSDGPASDDRPAPSKSARTEHESDHPTAADRPSSPSSGENSVFRIGFDGSVREVFREKGMVLSLLKLKDRLYVGTGSQGQLFEVQESTRERSEIARLDHGQIQRLYPRRDGSILLAAGDPGKLYVLQDRYANSGIVLGEAIDAKLVSRWGAISWQADMPAGTKLSVAVRGGNVAEPDDTWSEWSAEQTDPRNATAGVPPARFLQFRVSLATADTSVSPVLHDLSIRYATLNQAPEVTSLEVPNLDSTSSKDSKKLRIKWSATDANEDELVYEVYVRKEGWKDWIRIEEGYPKTDYEWDTTTMPTGTYTVKVVASDRPDNNEADALTGERVSGPVAVSHEAPTVTFKLAGIEKNRAAFEASANSSLVRLSAASYSLDGGKWTNVYPSSGLFDSREAKFRFNSDALEPGSHVMVLRVRDAAGNTGNADVVFTVKQPEK